MLAVAQRNQPKLIALLKNTPRPRGVLVFVRKPKNQLWFVGMLGRAVGATKSRRCDFPGFMAVKALVLCQVCLLEAFITTAWTNTACIQPVAVGVNTVLDMILIYFYP